MTHVSGRRKCGWLTAGYGHDRWPCPCPERLEPSSMGEIMVQVTMSSEPHRGDRAASSLPPVHHGFVETSSRRIHCAEVVGVGPPLIMLHGIGMDWRVWQAISRRLVPFFHLYLLDLRGHGQSDKPAQGYSLAHYAADVEDIIDQLRLNGAILLGSSLGGMV